MTLTPDEFKTLQDAYAWGNDMISAARVYLTRLDTIIKNNTQPAPISTLPPKSKGIDVSHYQGVIDWNRVKASGIAFAFIKATESINFTDDRFTINWAAAKTAGVLRSAYHFYRFNADPVSQANYFVSLLGSDFGELPPVCDAEDTSTSAKGNDLRLFCERVFSLVGRKPIIYTGNWWWNDQRFGGSQAWAKDYLLWIAHYGAQSPSIPKDWSTWAFWQYANNGHVDGIQGNVDLDVTP